MYDVEDGIFTQRVASCAPEVGGNRAYLRSLIRRKHYLYEKYNGRGWALPDFDQFTHVIIHYPALLEFLIRRADTRARILFDTHNNEREYFESIAAQTPNPVKRRLIRHQSVVSERIIAKAAHALTATISVSESDRDWVAQLCGQDVKHFVVPNNLFQYEPTTWTGRKTILYVGSLNVNMNIQALEWFTSKVWPRLKELVPAVAFVVAGRNPNSSLVKNLQQLGITVVANAPTLTALYADAVCSLIPAASGSGGKIKVGEALAHGVPVITTTHGLVGQPEAIKKCCIVSDNPDEWVEAIRGQLDREMRSAPAWDAQVKKALDETYFGSSVQQVAEFIDAG
ncbi:glycosyltransferase family 4 protein [Mycolicibacterium austroafricanum]|uniref:glycosyltransferase family 4 protein n=1 Tax=Mycolicibacterium austroafricanum TaxID=39687 RepID=UPI001ABFC5A5|nr:glycosyltransferase family 4 protein [Mycolicibacterium austroafricanum]QRZ08330.1 glycosyltransferase family 4 protein [Mycolicibacterium austroafricanum]QZT69982.1 glycosyltransferase family 4 protein [Mycolicibacterium austroafricanum]